VEVTYFRERRSGPEALIEDAVAKQIPGLFPSQNYSLWTAGSPSIGAGMPDLVIVSSQPQILVLAQFELSTAHILAYLRAVGCASLKKISDRIGMPQETIIRCLNGLVQVEVVSRGQNTYSLSPIWRDILPEIVTIEVKVTKWKRAVEQAKRNRVFAHRSFVAFPDYVAERVQSEPIFGELGIGLLSVGSGHTVSVLRNSRRHKPLIWTYYYQIASLVARHQGNRNNAV